MLAPNTPRIVHAELEDIFIEAVQPGQSVEVTLGNDYNFVYKSTGITIG